jgi:hypothetical protein
MWVLQGTKPLFTTPRYEGDPELMEQEKLLVLELEAQLIHSICQIFTQDQNDETVAPQENKDKWQYTFRG